MFAIGCKPTDLPAQTPSAHITSGAVYRPVRHSLRLVNKSPGNVLSIRIKLYVDLRLLILGYMKDIERIILQHIFLDQCQYFRGVVGITEGTVKRNILLDREMIDGVLQRPS